MAQSHQDLLNQIEALDLSVETERMVTKEGIDRKVAEVAMSLYRKFVYLSIKHGFSLTPSKLIDEAWHQHMADTRKYRADCIRLCGTMIDHDPNLVGQIMEDQFDVTKSLFQQEFGIDIARALDGIMDKAAACGNSPANSAAACGNRLAEIAGACGNSADLAAACGNRADLAAACGNQASLAAACGNVAYLSPRAHELAGVAAACGN